MRIFLIIIFLFLSSYLCPAQKEFYNWYFGKNAGITFMPKGTNPTALTDGKLDSYEGCATISDYLGRLLFYTDGITVWNKKHIIMQNGTGLFGGFVQNLNGASSVQSSLIIANPEKANIFYIFTTDAAENTANSKGLNYSIVDMSLDNGNGGITQKNIQLLPVCSEKLTATLHSNGKDFWVMAQVGAEASFYTYLVTGTGVGATPVISAVGTQDPNNGYSNVGAMKFSPSGRKLANNDWSHGLVEIFDFDKSSGILTNSLILKPPFKSYIYGVEFSPNESKLYVSLYMPHGLVLQYDFNASDIQEYEIIAENKNTPPHSLQLGPDNKIYISMLTSHYLAVISNPDSLGAKCIYQDNGVYLGDAVGLLGLPNSVVFPCKVDATIKATSSIICSNDSAELSVEYEHPLPISYKWSTGELTDKITVKEAGDYSVIVTNYYGCFDSLMITIAQSPSIVAEIKSTKPVFCNDEETIELFVESKDDKYTYKWNTGEATDRITIDKAGTYSVVVSNEWGCSDSLHIDIIQSPPIIAEIHSSKAKLCEGSTLDLFIETDGQEYTYKWNTGETTDRITIDSAGDYSIVLANQYGCTEEYKTTILNNEDSFSFIIDSVYAQFGEDTFINGRVKSKYESTDFILKDVNIIIAFDSQSILLKEISPTPVSNSSNNQKEIVLEFHFGSLTINSTTDIIIKIQGLTLLGDSLTYPIRIESFTYSNKEICFDTYDGVLKLDEVCEYYLRQLQSFILSNFTTSFSQQSSHSLEIQLETQEEGTFTFDLYNSFGAKVDGLSFNLFGKDVKHKTLNFDMTSNSQGLYFLILNSQYTTKTQKIFYLK